MSDTAKYLEDNLTKDSLMEIIVRSVEDLAAGNERMRIALRWIANNSTASPVSIAEVANKALSE